MLMVSARATSGLVRPAAASSATRHSVGVSPPGSGDPPPVQAARSILERLQDAFGLVHLARCEQGFDRVWYEPTETGFFQSRPPASLGEFHQHPHGIRKSALR